MNQSHDPQLDDFQIPAIIKRHPKHMLLRLKKYLIVDVKIWLHRQNGEYIINS